MATIRSFTTLEQSKKLAEILPIESADMCYSNDGTAIKIDANPYTVRYSMWKDYVAEIIPCWSLAALLSVLPEKYTELIKEGDMYRIIIKDSYITCLFDNPVDACYSLILKLHELNLL